MIGGKNQSVAEGAIAVQTDGNVVINQQPAISTDELRDLVTKEFHAEFFKLLGMAGDIATARADAVLAKFIDRIEKSDPAIMQQASEPDFRHAIYVAQKATARAGDENLENLLVELLVQRGKEAKRNLLQIVLNESLEAAGMLTDEQIATLTLVFIVRNTTNHAVHNLSTFLSHANIQFEPYALIAARSKGTFSHLTHARCGAVSLGEATLEIILSATYPGVWQVGIAKDDPCISTLQPYARSLLVACEHAPQLLRINLATEEQLLKTFKHLDLSVDDQKTLTELFNRPRLAGPQIKEICIQAAPFFAFLFELWDQSEMKNFLVSNIGMAIGHANVSRTQRFVPLSVWIN